MLVDNSATVKFVWSKTWLPLLIFIAIGFAAPLMQHYQPFLTPRLPLAVAGALGSALAIFLGFRNQSGYDRWWEARKLWGRLVNASRSFARQVLTLIKVSPETSTDQLSALQRDLILRTIAYANALRYHLREQDDRYTNLVDYLSVDDVNELDGSTNIPMRVAQGMGERIAEAHERGMISDYRQMQLDDMLTELLSIQGGCERIKNTQMPRHYDLFPRLFLWVYVFLLPESLVVEVGWLTPILSIPLSLLFHVLDVSGRYIERPFENRPTDTQMTALCGTIEKNLRELLGEKDVEVELSMVDGYVF